MNTNLKKASLIELVQISQRPRRKRTIKAYHVLDSLQRTLEKGITYERLSKQLQRFPRVFGNSEEYINFLFRSGAAMLSQQYANIIVSPKSSYA